MKIQNKIGFILGPLAFILIRLWVYPEGLSPQANAVLGSTVWIAIWWITETLPLAVTSLLPIVLFPLTGALNIQETTASYGHEYIFLFIGGFILAIAIEKWNLHKRIALTIIFWVGTNVRSIILGFMLATAFLSMWISNTATAVMLLPVGMALISQLKDNPQTLENENIVFGKALMLAIAYSASIGGIATLIGTPPNLVFAGVVEKNLHSQITFYEWFCFGFPVSITLLILCWLYLTRVAFNFKQNRFPGGKEEIDHQLTKLGKITFEEKWVFAIFTITAFAWISRSFLLSKWLPGIDDTVIAIAASILLFILPDKNKKPLLNWEDAVRLPWGILLLFGSGMALASGFESSGLASWLGGKFGLLNHIGLWGSIIIVVTFVNFFTEVTSNMATTAMILPIMLSLSESLGAHPYILLIAATLSASCAFMLPVATPPNAVVFGSGYLQVKDMVRIGFWMNLISIIVISLAAYFVLPYIWN